MFTLETGVSVTKLTTKVRTGVRGYLWVSFLIAAAALKTPTRNGYNAQGVNLIFWFGRFYAARTGSRRRRCQRNSIYVYIFIYAYICVHIIYIYLYMNIHVHACIRINMHIAIPHLHCFVAGSALREPKAAGADADGTPEPDRRGLPCALGTTSLGGTRGKSVAAYPPLDTAHDALCIDSITRRGSGEDNCEKWFRISLPEPEVMVWLPMVLSRMLMIN